MNVDYQRVNLLPNPSFESGSVNQGGTYAGLSAENSEATLSTDWAESGTQSVKVTPSGGDANTFITPTGVGQDDAQKAATNMGLQPGGRYTVAATLHLDEAQAGQTYGGARTIQIFAYAPGLTSVAGSVQAPNATGTYRLKVSFTYPPAATGLVVQLYNGSDTTPAYWDGLLIESGDTDGSYFDGDTAPDGTWTYSWTGTAHASASVANQNQRPRIAEAGVATVERAGIVTDLYTRSTAPIVVETVGGGGTVFGGQRVSLSAYAVSGIPVVWKWVVVSKQAVNLVTNGPNATFIAPDLEAKEKVCIATFASSADGRNRSKWQYFHITVNPPMARFTQAQGATAPVTPQLSGYERGQLEAWNDTMPPTAMSPRVDGKVKLTDIGITADDVQFTDGEVPTSAPHGAVYVDLTDGTIYRNFGAGYNETGDTFAAPRRNAYWLDPSSGVVYEWIED